MKTSALQGIALDWAVGKCEGLSHWLHGRVHYSTDWAQAGPIIQRERITIDAREHGQLWVAHSRIVGQDGITGPTPLIAALRAFVASKLGEEIDVPNELTGE
jgi:hypothetical protein